MVLFGWFGLYSRILTIVNPSKKKKKKDLIANSLVNSISESIKNSLVKKLENETYANPVET